MKRHKIMKVNNHEAERRDQKIQVVAVVILFAIAIAAALFFVALDIYEHVSGDTAAYTAEETATTAAATVPEAQTVHVEKTDIRDYVAELNPKSDNFDEDAAMRLAELCAGLEVYGGYDILIDEGSELKSCSYHSGLSDEDMARVAAYAQTLRDEAYSHFIEDFDEEGRPYTSLVYEKVCSVLGVFNRLVEPPVSVISYSIEGSSD